MEAGGRTATGGTGEGGTGPVLLTLVVPTRNEAGNVGWLVRRLREGLGGVWQAISLPIAASALRLTGNQNNRVAGGAALGISRRRLHQPLLKRGHAASTDRFERHRCVVSTLCAIWAIFAYSL